MRRLGFLAGIALSFILLVPCRAQDIVKVAPQHSRILLENDDVRVVQTTLAPGETDPVHTHPSGWYYVVQPGSMKVTLADGKVSTWNSQAGEGGWLTTRSPHSDENVGKSTIVWVLVEIKSAEKSRH